MATTPMEMGDASSLASSSPPLVPALAKKKPIIVRVKRKPSQACPDAIWLEINERPTKKSMLDFSSLLESWSLEAPQEPQRMKLLVQYVKTIHHSEAVEGVLHSLLKQEQLRSTTKQKDEDLVRNACFAQIRRSQIEDKGKIEESIRKICHLYDAIQLDPEEAKHQIALDGYVYDIYTVKEAEDTSVDDGANATYPLLQVENEDDEYLVGPDNCDYEADDSNEEPSEEGKDDEFENLFYTIDGLNSEHDKKEVYVESDEDRRQRAPHRASRISSFEDSAMLCNFLPLLREHLPSAAEEIESDVISLRQSEDGHVYDVHTVKEGDDISMDDATTATYPLLQVDHEDGEYYFGPDSCDYDTDDSNAEDNPLFDYPEEGPSKKDEDDEFDNPFNDLDCSGSEYEKEKVYADSDEDYFLWRNFYAVEVVETSWNEPA